MKAKRVRRTKLQLREAEDRLYKIVEANRPVTVRQAFYLAVSAGLVPKTEQAYKQTVGRLLVQMRRSGRMPYSWIADPTRWMRKPRTFSSLEDALTETARTYRRALWDSQDVYVEVWSEKDAIAGVLLDVTREWDVPLMVTRGFPSVTYLWEAAAVLREVEKPSYLYYFGDRDPSGVCIDRSVDEQLHEMAPYADFEVVRVAVRPEQVTEMRLPTRPTKSTDSRSRAFTGNSVEVDAIPPNTLREMVRGCIEQHVDHARLEVLKVAERSEREVLQRLASRRQPR